MPLIEPAGELAAGAPTYADLTVRVDLGRQDLAGELIIEGHLVSTFTGWLGLLTALDQALDTFTWQAQKAAPSERADPDAAHGEANHHAEGLT